MSRKTGLQISGKSIEVERLRMKDSRVNFTSVDGDITISRFESNGDYPKSLSNAAVSINTNGSISFTDSVINQTGYNGIEIGLNNTAPNKVLIENVDFESTLSNNAILIFAHGSGAEITLRNCIFRNVSNVLRISNRTNVPATINIEDCICESWDKTPEYAGFLMFQDYTSTTEDEVIKSNRFHNLTVNVKNLIGPNGYIKPENVADVMPGGSGDQFCYIYSNKVGMITYSEDRYPTFNFM